MILVFCFMPLILSCLPLIHAAADGNISMPICPESFSCPGLGTLKYPFYNGTDRKCGLIKINCTSKDIQFGGWSREIVTSFDYGHKYDGIIINNRTFEQLLKVNRCASVMDNFTSPRPLLYSISIYPFITLFKCTKNLTYAYFDQHNYNSYNSCKDHNFYYNYFNGTVPSDLPHTCQVVHLPVRWSPSPGVDEINIFSLLSPVTDIVFNLSDSCRECQEKGLRCETTEDRLDVRCFDVIQGIYSFFIMGTPKDMSYSFFCRLLTAEKPGTELTPVQNLGNSRSRLIQGKSI